MAWSHWLRNTCVTLAREKSSDVKTIPSMKNSLWNRYFLSVAPNSSIMPVPTDSRPPIYGMECNGTLDL